MNDVDDALAAVDRIGSYKQPTVGEWAAIRLAEEVRALRARVATLEADNAAMVRHLDALEDPAVADNEVAHLRARVAELESEVRNVTYDRDGAQDEVTEYGNKFVQAQQRVAELEAQQGEPAGTEWGVRWPDGYVSAERTEEGARREVVATGRELVSRTNSPWRVST